MILCLHDTIPYEQDWYEHYKIFRYRISMWVSFVPMLRHSQTVVADLNEYYEWAKDNNIEMKHSITRLSDGIGGQGLIVFMFQDESYAMAFKLRWK